jgi:hypothetical protein
MLKKISNFKHKIKGDLTGPENFLFEKILYGM